MAATSSDASHSTQDQIRTVVLTLLTEEPYNGLEIIKEVGERTGNNWRLADADLYPLLEQLSTEGLIRLAMSGGGFSRQRPYELTEQGREYVTQHAESLVPLWSVWAQEAPAAPTHTAPPAPPAPTAEEETHTMRLPAEGAPASAPAAEPETEPVEPVSTAAERFRDAADRFSVAVDQVLDVGTDLQLERARQLVAESKRGLYQILATEEEDDADRTTD
ncbi:helix-turn-helix transcriptional regulator [Spiractinospora alimapuensis]|uniref:PadR family transcriptional regulator n=1 Tax=Spiractinospora alimapuensis TaxID=2820884 RepID=UPI001F2F73D3|nr:PadR family transcriptional regulator [Spiractinospora alimapuensis]QVQ52979.1 helix-turn-helix transcriptional regulator [Spiractinospora alimapuensis]